MRSIKEQLILVYCLADDGLKSEKNGGQWRKSNHNPKLRLLQSQAIIGLMINSIPFLN